jgi:hypothetical protein
LASANGSGRIRTAFTTLKIALFAAIVSATVTITVSEKTGARRRVRMA